MLQRILPLISLSVLVGCALIPQAPVSQEPRETSPGEIEWQASFKEAVKTAGLQNKPIMLVFYGVSSKRLDKRVFSAPAVIELAQEFVSLKIGARQGDLTQKYIIQEFPTIVFTDPRGGEYDRSVGYKSWQSFVEVLKSALIPVEVEYSLRIEPVHRKSAQVTCVFRNVRFDSLILTLREKHDKISNISYSSDDYRPGWEVIDEDVWRMKFTTSAMKTVTVQYEVELNITSRMSYVPEYISYVGEDYGVLDGYALFMMPNNLRTTGKAEVNLSLPAGWHSITPWKETGNSSFVAGSVDEVVDSVFCIGEFQYAMSQLGEHEIYAVLSGADEDSLDLEQKADEMVEIFRDYVMRFGDFPFKRYLGIFTGPTSDDKCIHGSAHGTGFTGPLYVDHTFMAHEAFHVWNGGITTQKSDYEVWFKEGFTQYYGYLTPYRIGIYNRGQLLRHLGRDYGAYLRKYGTKDDMPLTRVREKTARREGFEQPSSARAWIMYYKGALVASLMDGEIRRRTNGRKSLDDLMYYMFQEFRERQYSSEDVLEALNTVTQQDFSQFFSDFVYGKARLPAPAVDYLGKK